MNLLTSSAQCELAFSSSKSECLRTLYGKAHLMADATICEGNVA